jgi:hypothetical protein
MDAMVHLQRVLRREIEDSASLSGFLDLVANEAVLKQDRAGVNEAIAWGLTVMGKTVCDRARSCRFVRGHRPRLQMHTNPAGRLKYFLDPKKFSPPAPSMQCVR